MTHIHTIRIHDIDEITAERWLAWLDDEWRQQLMRRRHRDDILRSLAGEAMVRILAGKHVGVAPRELRIARPRQGKPYLPDHPAIHFNISHAGDWVVCAISDAPIGIDVEQIRKSEIKPALRKKVLTDNEMAYLQTLSADGMKATFYRLFSLKEAYLKYRGDGLAIDLRRLEIELDGDGGGRIRDGRDGMTIPVAVVEFHGDYVLSICPLPVPFPAFAEFAKA